MSNDRKLLIVAAALALASIFLSGCGDKRMSYDTKFCTSESTPAGVYITCSDETVFIPRGTDGLDGEDGSDGIVELIDVCGDGPGLDEVLIRLSTGQLIAYFRNGSYEHISVIPDGAYVTTDQQRCHFNVIGGQVY